MIVFSFIYCWLEATFFLCTTQGGSLKLGDCNLDEEEVLVALMMKRKRRLEEEAEARRSTTDSLLTPVPTQSTTAGIDLDEEQTQQVKENLIDTEATDDETLILSRLQSLVLHLQLRPLSRSSLLLKPHAASDPPRGSTIHHEPYSSSI